ncbi:hypothetical protein KP509_03G073200 [Ceratopteris richardii]|uniref:DUF1995 domain-containing protein n=1 Tax=Ceratopteris richardii TaxID=49495 RepID=A0A8T2V834_CERRI|nr:hypothetical protein KP509_03G073200 [Ceratopteris richardii]
MAVCTQLIGARLNPLQVPSTRTLQLRHADRLSSASPPQFSSRPNFRQSQYIHRLCTVNSVNGPSETPPESRDEALSQARGSISVFLEKALRDAGPTTVKQRKLQRQARLRVELPLLDESEAARASLLSDLLFTLSVGKRRTSVSFSVYSSASVVETLKQQLCGHSEEGQDSEDLKNPRFQFGSIEDFVDVDDSEVVVILAPKLSDVEYIINIAESAYPRPVLLLNPGWVPEEEEKADTSFSAFLQSFEVVYSYLPLAIQGFFNKTEGAVLKHVKGGAPAGRPWLIFVREGESLKCVASMKKRPTSIDLENALYNSIAANSPVTKSIKFLRGLLSKEN